jgi:hypothetical protein
MNVRARVGALLSCVSIAASSVSVAASCPFLTLDEQFAQSAVVFVGRSTGQRVVAALGIPGGRATETTFRVEDVWKGTLTKAWSTRTCGFASAVGPALTCSDSVRFDVGARYVVFSTGDTVDATACMTNERVENAGKVLQWLSAKPHRKIR